MLAFVNKTLSRWRQSIKRGRRWLDTPDHAHIFCARSGRRHIGLMRRRTLCKGRVVNRRKMRRAALLLVPALVALSFFLPGGFKPLSGLLGSDLLIQTHQLFARTALVLLVLHPFFYSLWGAPAGPVDPSATQTLRIGSGSWGLGIAPRSYAAAKFRAGQFAWIQPGQRWPHHDNPFSISNAPGANGQLL
jgi:predicted ferric reductase